MEGLLSTGLPRLVFMYYSVKATLQADHHTRTDATKVLNVTPSNSKRETFYLGQSLNFSYKMKISVFVTYHLATARRNFMLRLVKLFSVQRNTDFRCALYS